MEKSELPIKDHKIIEENWVPTLPTSKGVWKDKCKDHDVFQMKVSLAAQLGGAHASAGCPTDSAEQARRNAEQQYYRSQEKHPKQILKENKIK